MSGTRHPSSGATLLTRARRSAGLSQRELAEACGVAQSTIARIESGVTDPSVGLIERLLSACGHSLVLEQRRALDVSELAQVAAFEQLSPQQRLDAAVNLARARFEAGVPG